MTPYNDYIETLPRIVGKGNVFSFNDDPLRDIFARYFRFCLSDLRDQILWQKWDVTKCRVFFRDINIPNAKACKKDGETWIEVNRGLFSKLFYLFYEKRSHLERLQEHAILKRFFPEDELYNVMFTTTTIFLYYHELGHIIQYDRSANNFETEERSIAFACQRFDIMRHVREYDSDEFSANFLYERIKRKFYELHDDIKSREILLALMTSSTAAIFILFEMLGGQIRLPIHYKKGSHPHVIFRILIINTLIIKKMTIDFEEKYHVSKQEVADRSFEILTELSTSKYSLRNFSHAINSESDKIKAYITELKEIRKQFPWMAMIRLRAATSDSSD